MSAPPHIQIIKRNPYTVEKSMNHLDQACKQLQKNTPSPAKLLIMEALKLNDKGKTQAANDKAKQALELM